MNDSNQPNTYGGSTMMLLKNPQPAIDNTAVRVGDDVAIAARLVCTTGSMLNTIYEVLEESEQFFIVTLWPNLNAVRGTSAILKTSVVPYTPVTNWVNVTAECKGDALGDLRHWGRLVAGVQPGYRVRMDAEQGIQIEKEEPYVSP